MSARYFVDPWDPSYGTSASGTVMDESSADLDLDLETPVADWAPVTPAAGAWEPAEVHLVDGVRRIEARVWAQTATRPDPMMALAASYAAGVVRLDGRAQVMAVRTGRGLYTACAEATDITTPMGTYPVAHTAGETYDDLVLAVQRQMRELELVTAHAVRNGSEDLLILDGPLRGRERLPLTIGYIKSHHAAYLPPEYAQVISRLQPGQRTPVFTIGTTWSRHTWYLKLPVAAALNTSPWAGVVRCEVSELLSATEAAALADTSATVLPRLASQPHKDARAPQNLIPIGGLEKTLRHRLGDQTKLHRAVSIYAAHMAVPGG